MKLIDFNKFAEDLCEKGAARSYEKPLGSGRIDLNQKGVYRHARFPEFPGDESYGNGPMVLARFEEDLPQELIKVQSQSISDALKIFMPPQQVARHMCTFIQSDFQDTAFYQTRLEEYAKRPINPKEEADFRQSWGSFSSGEYPKEELSCDYNKSHRLTGYRINYTLQELGIAKKVIDEKPEVLQTVCAFQAGCEDFLENLSEGVRQADIAGQEKKRMLDICKSLKDSWDTNNFLREMLPAMALAYHERDPSHTSESMPQDFNRGFEIAMNLGLFRNKEKAPRDSLNPGERSFSCPARATIGGVMARDGESLEAKPSDFGTMMGMIVKEIQKRKTPRSKVKLDETAKRSTSSSGCPFGHK